MHTLKENNPYLVSVAAVPYFWSKQSYFDFYQQLATTEADIVYLGETVCSKRRQMNYNDWLEVAAQLTDAGKQVMLSTLTLLEAESELKQLRKIATQSDFIVEANDMAAIQCAYEAGRPFVAGCAINLYNERALCHLINMGMKRWVVPVELGKEDLIPLAKVAAAEGCDVEYQVFGRMPLAYSARCFTARHLKRNKDQCEFKCIDYPQGIAIKTQEGDSFAQINGIQTQSMKVTNLLSETRQLSDSGVDIMRIVPVDAETTFDAIRTLKASAKEAKPFAHDELEYCNGYWHQIAGMQLIS